MLRSSSPLVPRSRGDRRDPGRHASDGVGPSQGKGRINRHGPGSGRPRAVASYSLRMIGRSARQLVVVWGDLLDVGLDTGLDLAGGPGERAEEEALVTGILPH